MSLRYFAFDILRSIFCIRYFVRRYLAYSIFCRSIFCDTIFCDFDILRIRYFAIRYFANSIFCGFDILRFRYFAFDILRSIFCDSIFCFFDILSGTCRRHPTLDNYMTAGPIAFKFGCVVIDQLAITFAQVRDGVHMHVRTCTLPFPYFANSWADCVQILCVLLGAH